MSDGDEPPFARPVRRDPNISITGENGHRELPAGLYGPRKVEQRVTVATLAAIIAALTLALVIVGLLGLLAHEVWRAMLIGWWLG